MKKLIFILIFGGMMLQLFGCSKEETKYNVNYNGQKSLFKGAKDSYKEGEKVKLLYDLIGTDTDYSFSVDDAEYEVSWNSLKQGYEITFKMPAHDVSVYCSAHNSMVNPVPFYSEYLPLNTGNDGVIVEDIMSCADFVGREAGEAGIPDSVISGSGSLIKAYIEGKVFGKEDYAVAFFRTEGRINYVKSIWIHVRESSYEECYSALTEIYGEAVDGGEEPYVEADGGAVTWSRFEGNNLVIRLSSASMRDYCEIDISENN